MIWGISGVWIIYYRSVKVLAYRLDSIGQLIWITSFPVCNRGLPYDANKFIGIDYVSLRQF
jgi:hypothetical protein